MAQSNLASISCLAIGVKLSMSSPREARTDLMCGGTSWWLSSGRIESSVVSKLASLWFQTIASSSIETYRDVRSQIGWEDPSTGRFDASSQAILC